MFRQKEGHKRKRSKKEKKSKKHKKKHKKDKADDKTKDRHAVAKPVVGPVPSTSNEKQPKGYKLSDFFNLKVFWFSQCFTRVECDGLVSKDFWLLMHNLF